LATLRPGKAKKNLFTTTVLFAIGAGNIYFVDQSFATLHSMLLFILVSILSDCISEWEI
jgi:arginine exporter protein ArgO